MSLEFQQCPTRGQGYESEREKNQEKYHAKNDDVHDGRGDAADQQRPKPRPGAAVLRRAIRRGDGALRLRAIRAPSNKSS